MKERIIEFLKLENKSSAQLALEIGVQPSSISHIVSGRNNPSLDFVLKMLSRYPSLSADWLLFGKGKMSKESTLDDLFDTSSLMAVPESNTGDKNITSDEDKTIEHRIKMEKTLDEEKRSDVGVSRTKKIICFFDNNTFMEYFPVKE
jgi:transcriptional regulator with XRE-family HTH domain